MGPSTLLGENGGAPLFFINPLGANRPAYLRGTYVALVTHMRALRVLLTTVGVVVLLGYAVSAAAI